MDDLRRNTVAVFAALGLVTSRGEGTATITATSCSGKCSAKATSREPKNPLRSRYPIVSDFLRSRCQRSINSKVVDVEGYPVAGDTVTWSSSDWVSQTLSSLA
ncbi:MAG: hypothetical protein CM1200mP14_26040 [Gammaproteobacteria bacterium]|nr:MAG: hypothetical protein CM1200mP14_26040 [Gammaproteobacteria bacterium]